MKYSGGFKFAFLACLAAVLSIYVAIYCLESDTGSSYLINSPENLTVMFSMKIPMNDDLRSITEATDRPYFLQENFYKKSCPHAEKIIRTSLRDMYDAKPSIAPSLVRLLFHDCFIGGCDASVLLDTDKAFASEKEAPPNLSLKGFDVIDIIKSEIENVCPGVVSCADILVLAARESIKLAGGPRYIVKTGRRDRLSALKEAAGRELPAPQSNLSVILASFESKGFDSRETVALLGAHSIGITHCEFFEDRLYSFSGTGKPDPQLNPDFLQELKAKCPFTTATSSPSATTGSTPSSHASDYHKNFTVSSKNRNDRVIDLSFNNEGGQKDFGIRYYKRLMQRKGVMFSDQQLLAKDETERWVIAYASDPHRFRKDFAKAMTKLSSHKVLTGPQGEVRKTCSKVL